MKLVALLADIRRRQGDAKVRNLRSRALLSMMRPYRLRIAALLATLLVTMTASLAPAPLAARAVDDGLAKGDTGLVTTLVIAFLVISVVGMAASMAQDRMLGWLGARILSDLRERIFNHLIQMPVSYHERQRAGVLLSRMTNDVEALQTMVSDSLVTLIRSILMLIGSMVILLTLDVKLALVTFLTIPLLVLASMAFRLASVDAFAQTRETIGALTAQLQETLSGVRIIRSFGRESVHLTQFDELGTANRKANMKTVYLNAAYFPAVEYLATIAVVIVLLVGGGEAISGAVTIGVLIGFVTALDNFFGPISDLSNVYTTFQSGMAALDKIGSLLEEESTLNDPEHPRELPNPLRGELVFDHVSFRYGADLPPVIEDISLRVKAGSTVALVGQTGAGKSTLAKLAARFIDPVEGQVLLDGIDLREFRQRDLRSRLGIVPQESFLFSGTVAENIAFGRDDATREQIEAAVASVGATEVLDLLPQGIDTEVGERGGSLSAGQRQLAAFARAMIADPQLLLLDEATSNVDLRTEKRIERALETLLEGRTAIVIAHRLSTIQSADLIAVVTDGSIIESGTHDELLQLGGTYAKLQDDWQHGSREIAPLPPAG